MTEEPPSVDELIGEERTIKYLVSTRGGEFVINLPTHYKLTFGAVNPGSPPHGRDLHCLRVWDGPPSGKGRLRAVFCDVRGFRDLSLPLARKVEVQTGQAQWTRDDLGNFETNERREIQSSWQGEYGPLHEPSEDDPF
jgi:hypothetical protein